MTELAQHPWLFLLLAAVLSTAVAWLLIPLALNTGWADHPDARKVHEHSTPLVGGVAVYLAWSVVVILSPAPELSHDHFYAALLCGSLVLLLTGLFDDLRNLSPAIRFLVQVGTCLLMIRFTGMVLTDFGALFTGQVLYLGWLAVPVTVFAAMGVINSFNLIDGLDGLSGTLFVIAGAGMALFAGLEGRWVVLWLVLLALASVSGFLVLNARFPWNSRARVFLGDAGSLMLGFVLAWCFIRLGSGVDRTIEPMTAVWLIAVPLLDTSTLIWRRWRAGRPVFSADQNHLHHAFLRAGYSVGETWARISLLALALAVFGIGFELSEMPEWVSFYTFMVVAFSYYFYLKHSWSTQRFLGRHFIHHDFEIDEGYA